MHLIDCFMQEIAYLVTLRDGVAAEQPGFEQVQADFRRLLSLSETMWRQEGKSPEDFDQARFMVCAWADELLLASDWNQKQLWQREQLQRLYYGTTDAGVEAFERLNALGFHQRDVREVYYLCLTLGFKGRFVNNGDEFLLEQLKTSNLRMLIGDGAGPPSLEKMVLFPGAIQSPAADAAAGARRFRPAPAEVLALVVPVILFGLLYLIYHFALRGVAGKLA